MSVTNYTPDNCRYWIGKLSKHVYLISEDAVKDIRIDNGEAWVQSVSESPIRIDCISISLSEEESLDERYKFVHTLSFSVNGYANKDDFQGRYYVIVKDNNNTYWLVNPLFPCKVTYTYTLANEQNQTDFTIGTASNHPVLKLNGMSEGEPYQCQDYWLDGIDKIWLNEKRYSVHDGNNVKYTNDGFKVIDYNGKSATFTESFDGENTRHSIEFNVLFSDYKSSWHYNLLEIVDECIKNNNLYSAIIKTRNDKYAMCGFSFGLQPSFNISADDTIQEMNRIQITLQDAHTVGDAIDILDSVNYEYLSARTWVYTDEYDGYMCVDNGVAKYLLQKEVDALGNDTCNYKAFVGYENSFPELNIVGTFDSTVTFPKNECSTMPCIISTSLPMSILFTDFGSKTYTLRAGSDWAITHNEDISVTPSSGAANQDYTITVQNNHTPTDEAWITNLTVSYCLDMEHNSVVTVIEDEDSCFQRGTTYNIDSDAQTVTIPTQCCIQSVKEKTSIGVTTNIYNDYITVYVPENDDGYNRTILLLVQFCDGSVANLNINQNAIIIPIYRWYQTTATTCIGDSVGTIEDYFTISGGGNVTFSSNYLSNTIYYSQNGGDSWQVLNGTVYNNTGKVIFKGVNLNAGDGTGESQPKGIGIFSATTSYKVGGNIMSLVAGDDFLSADTVPNYYFYSLFDEYIIERHNLLEAIDLYLPASTLGIDCYRNMFSGCRLLTKAPEVLPAMALNDGCYREMFLDCPNLRNTPKLIATTLAPLCYSRMFAYCTSLTTPPALPATTLADYCYLNMFQQCSGLTSTPVLPATTMKEGCYQYMFQYCTSLTTVPDIIATSYAPYCYEEMFKGCTNIDSARITTSVISPGDMARMFDDTAQNGVLYKQPSVIIPRYNLIPETWSIVNL